MIEKKGGFNMNEFSKGLISLNSKIPKIIANAAKNHFLEGFRQGGKQTNDSRGGWTARKREDRKRPGRAILVDSGDLRADIKAREVSPVRVVVGTNNIPYSIAHNEGTDKIPQREFIGESTELEIKIRKIIEAGLKNIKP